MPIPLFQKFNVQLLLKNKTKVVICIQNLISISGGKFHLIISTVKFHMQFEKKIIALNRSTYIW